ncbi:MAG: lamin tail domain-containing protein, partial [Bacteroidota bacterium]
NSPADSNGDDNLELVDPFGKVIDVFGIIGEDGSGTNHEFEDGRALRKPEVVKGNSIYTFEEWMLYNDTGESGTTKEPKVAPQDFTPRDRN